MPGDISCAVSVAFQLASGLMATVLVTNGVSGRIVICGGKLLN